MPQLTAENLDQWKDAQKAMGTLIRGLQDVVQVVTDRKDVHIRLGTNTCTDGETIFIEPPPEVFKGRAVTEAVKARVYHEAAHILYTQFVDKGGEQILVKARKAHGRSFCDMVNAVEDARVEKNLFKDFPGVEKHLVSHLDAISRITDFTVRDEDEQVTAGTYLVGAGYDVTGLFTPRVEETLKGHTDLVDEVIKCHDSQDIYGLAEEVWKAYQKEGYFSEGEDEPAPIGDPELSEDEGDSDEDFEEPTEGQQGQGMPGEGGQEGPGTGEDDEKGESADSVGGGEDEDEGEEGTTLLEEIQIGRAENVTDQQAAQNSRDVQKALNGKIVGIRYGEVVGLVEKKVQEVSTWDKEAAERVMANGAGVTGFLTTHLRSVFKDNAKTRFSGQYSSGRKINKRDLYKIAAETSDKVFSRRNKPGKVDYAVMLGVDSSGSMYEEYGGMQRMHRAANAALLVVKVLNNLGIKSKVVGFTSTVAHAGGEDAYHTIYKDWNEGGSLEVLGRLKTMDADQYNLDGYFLQEAYRELRTRREAKRILIVLSDGNPYLDRDHQIELMRKNINKMSKEGIEVIGVGIATDSVEAYYKNNIVVWDEEELGQKLVKVLHDALLK